MRDELIIVWSMLGMVGMVGRPGRATPVSYEYILRGNWNSLGRTSGGTSSLSFLINKCRISQVNRMNAAAAEAMRLYKYIHNLFFLLFAGSSFLEFLYFVLYRDFLEIYGYVSRLITYYKFSASAAVVVCCCFSSSCYRSIAKQYA